MLQIQKRFIRYIKTYPPFFFSAFLVVVLSVFFRFWNYSNRWGLAYDQAQFALVARYAVDTIQLPLLGPFSSGGPFQTGGEWYWIVMIGTALYPNSILSPWIFVTALTVVAVIVMIAVGKIFNDSRFGVILGLLIAVSPAQVHQSTNLTNQTPIVLLSAFSLMFGLLFIRKKRLKYLFFQSLAVGIGTSIHIQAVALIPFLLLTWILFSKAYIKGLLLILIGLFIPWTPVLIADSQNNFYNTRSMLNYFSNEQAKTSYEVLGRRWLTFILDFIPESWGQIIGGNKLIGYTLIGISGLCFIASLVKRKVEKEVILVVASLAMMFVILRYIRTPLFESFFVFMHPFVIFLTGWVVYRIYLKTKIVGIALLFIVVISSINSFWGPINSATNHAYSRSNEIKEILYSYYPSKIFYVYDYGYKNGSAALPLVLNLYIDGRVSEKGFPIGLFTLTNDDVIYFEKPPLYGEYRSVQIYDLSSSDSARLLDLGWIKANPKYIYDQTQYWFLDK